MCGRLSLESILIECTGFVPRMGRNVVLETHTVSASALALGRAVILLCMFFCSVFLLGVLSELFQLSTEVSCRAYVKSPVL